MPNVGTGLVEDLYKPAAGRDSSAAFGWAGPVKCLNILNKTTLMRRGMPVAITGWAHVNVSCRSHQFNRKANIMFSMTSIRAAAIAALMGAAGAASAAVVTLDFEGVGNQAAILDFYNGGTDSQGNSGANYGVSFGSNALGIIDSDAGGGGNIGNEPTPSTVMFFLSGTAVLNYSAGFTDGFSFFYSTVSFGGTVNVYDDVNATGNLLGSIAISALGTGPGDPNGDFSNWAIGALGFAGTAKSIDFGGTVNQVAYDNVTFGSTDPNRVPEPTSLLLAGAALAALGAARRRRA